MSDIFTIIGLAEASATSLTIAPGFTVFPLSTTEQIPVILMRAALPEGVQAHQRVQARPIWSSLPKPFEMDTLLNLIRHLLQES